MIKLPVRIFLAMVVIVLVGAIGGYIWVRSIVVSAVEQAVTGTTGQEMTVTKISLQRFGGTMQWHGLMVPNPRGSNGSHLMQPCTFGVELELGSLLEDKLVFKKFELDGLNVCIDQQMPKNNISVIMDDLKKLRGDEPRAPEESESKKVQVELYTPRTTTKPGDGNDTATP